MNSPDPSRLPNPITVPEKVLVPGGCFQNTTEPVGNARNRDHDRLSLKRLDPSIKLPRHANDAARSRVGNTANATRRFPGAA